MVKALDPNTNFTVASDRSDRSFIAENHRIFNLNNTNERYASAESYAGKISTIGCVVKALDPNTNFALV